MKNMESLFTCLFKFYKDARLNGDESFGDFCFRIGPEQLKKVVKKFEEFEKDLEGIIEEAKDSPTPVNENESDFAGDKTEAEAIYDSRVATQGPRVISSSSELSGPNNAGSFI